MKDLPWRMRSIAVQRVSQDVVTDIDRVDVHITSKKVFLNGSRKNTSIPTKVAHFTVYNDGPQFCCTSGRSLIVIHIQGPE